MPQIRKTLRRIDQPGTARFLTFSCYRRLRLFDNDRIKNRFVERLTQVAQDKCVQVIAWVVMPEHVHLVLLPSESGVTVGSFLRSLKSPLSAEVLGVWRDRRALILSHITDNAGDHHFWQAGGGYDRNVWGQELLEKIRYCHANPVTRGLCERSVDWPWSSARNYEAGTTKFCDDAIGPAIPLDLLPRARGPLT